MSCDDQRKSPTAAAAAAADTESTAGVSPERPCPSAPDSFTADLLRPFLSSPGACAALSTAQRTSPFLFAKVQAPAIHFAAVDISDALPESPAGEGFSEDFSEGPAVVKYCPRGQCHRHTSALEQTWRYIALRNPFVGLMPDLSYCGCCLLCPDSCVWIWSCQVLAALPPEIWLAIVACWCGTCL